MAMTWNLSAPCWMRYVHVLSTQPAAKRWGPVKHSGSYERSAWARTWRGRYSLCSHCIIPNSGTESELTLQDRLARVMQLCVWVKKEGRGLAAPVSLTHTRYTHLWSYVGLVGSTSDPVTSISKEDYFIHLVISYSTSVY